MAGTVSNAVGLPTPETDAEHRAYEISRFVAPMVVGGGAAMTQGGQRAIGAAVEAGMGLAGKAAAAGTAVVQGARTAGNAVAEAGQRAAAAYDEYIPLTGQAIIKEGMRAADSIVVPGPPKPSWGALVGQLLKALDDSIPDKTRKKRDALNHGDL